MSCCCPLLEMTLYEAAGDGAMQDGGPGRGSTCLGANGVIVAVGADERAGEGTWLATLRMLGALEKECNAT